MAPPIASAPSILTADSIRVPIHTHVMIRAPFSSVAERQTALTISFSRLCLASVCKHQAATLSKGVAGHGAATPPPPDPNAVEEGAPMRSAWAFSIARTDLSSPASSTCKARQPRRRAEGRCGHVFCSHAMPERD